MIHVIIYQTYMHRVQVAITTPEGDHEVIPILRSLLRDNPPSTGKPLATPLGFRSRTIFEQWCGFFYVPKEPDQRKCCETGR